MQRKSLAVLFSLMSKVGDSPLKEEFITEVENILLKKGLCTEVDLDRQQERFQALIRELTKKVGEGLSYNEAFRRLRYRYPEFTNLKNIKNLN